jgi:hypothetical protein
MSFFNSAVSYCVYYKKSRIEGRKLAMPYKIIDYIQFYIYWKYMNWHYHEKDKLLPYFYK